MRMALVAVAAAITIVFVAQAVVIPPEKPVMPDGFNLHCDICSTMVRRVVPYCERKDVNVDFLPDFCVFNYNQVMRTECDYMMTLMEFVWCPSACEEIRKIRFFAADSICHHPLVNCTERDRFPSATPSPSPSASMPLAADCVFCEFILKEVAVLCMNDENADAKNIYTVCMENTKTKVAFEHCQHRLYELVALAGTNDPCDMVSCADSKVQCLFNSTDDECHIVSFNSTASALSLQPRKSPVSVFTHLEGVGPGDVRPGEEPFHFPLIPVREFPPYTQVPGHLLSPPPIDGPPTTPSYQ